MDQLEFTIEEDLPDLVKLRDKSLLSQKQCLEPLNMEFSCEVKIQNVKIKDVATECLSVFLVCDSTADESQDDWKCLVSADIKIGTVTKKLNHLFTQQANKMGYANFAPVAEIESESGCNEKNGWRKMKIGIRTLGGPVNNKLNEAQLEAYKHRFQSFITRKENELQYHHNPECGKKNLASQWHMAIRVICKESEEILQIYHKLESSGQQPAWIKQFDNLRKSSVKLRKEYIRLLSTHIPAVDRVAHFFAFDFDVRDIFIKTEVRAGTIKSLIAKNLVDGKVSWVRLLFLLGISDTDDERRTYTMKVFSEVFLAKKNQTGGSDLKALMDMKAEEYMSILRSTPNFELTLYLLNLFILTYNDLTLITARDEGNRLCIISKLVQMKGYPTEEPTVFEKCFFGQYGLLGLVQELMMIVFLSMEKSFHTYLLRFWRIAMDGIRPLLSIYLSHSGWKTSSLKLWEDQFRGAWSSANWQTIPRKEDKESVLCNCIKDKCESCRTTGADVLIPLENKINNFDLPLMILQRDHDLQIPVQPEDFKKWPVVKIVPAACRHRIAHFQHMIPEIAEVLLLTHNLGWDLEISSKTKNDLYVVWTMLKYRFLRKLLEEYLIIFGLIVKENKIICVSELTDKQERNNYQIYRMLRENQVYINKLLVHEDEFPCNHELVWEGEVVQKGGPTICIEKPCRLYSCPSLDSNARNKGWKENKELPWKSSGSCLALSMKNDSVRTSFLREKCWKLSFKGFEASPKDVNVVLLVFSRNIYCYKQQFVLLAKNEQNRWVAFVPHRTKDFFEETSSSIISSTQQNSAMAVFAQLEKIRTRQTRDLVMCRDRSYVSEFLDIHKKNVDSVKKLEMNPDPMEGPSPYNASHLVGCPHTMLWRGEITLIGLNHFNTMHKCSVSAWAFECPEALRPLKTSCKHPDPPAKFWVSMPSELVFVQTFRSVFRALDRPGQLLYSFVLDVGSIPAMFLRGYVDFPMDCVAFLFKDNGGLDYVIRAHVPLEDNVKKLICTVVGPSPGEPETLEPDLLFCKSIKDGANVDQENEEEDGEAIAQALKYAEGRPRLKVWHFVKTIVERKGFSGAEGMFQAGSTASVGFHSILHSWPTLRMSNHPRKVINDAAAGSMLWTGRMHFFYLLRCPYELSGFYEDYPTSQSELDSVCDDLQDMIEKEPLTGEELVFKEQAGALKNRAFLAETGHQVYMLDGCVTGTLPSDDFDLFSVKGEGSHTFVALTVSKKLVGNILAKFKKCYHFYFHLQDNMYIYPDIAKHDIDNYSMFGFFLPHNTTIPAFLQDKTMLESRFLILKFDMRIGAIVGFYPREKAKRSQLIQALFAKDSIGLTAHIKKLSQKKKELNSETKVASVNSTSAKTVPKRIEIKGTSESTNNIDTTHQHPNQPSGEEQQEDSEDAKEMKTDQKVEDLDIEEGANNVEKVDETINAVEKVKEVTKVEKDEETTSVEKDEGVSNNVVESEKEKPTESEHKGEKLTDALSQTEANEDSHKPVKEKFFKFCAACKQTEYSVEKLWLCAGCKKVRYCSSSCQQSHWKDHADWCLKKKAKREEKAKERQNQPKS